MYIYEHIAHNVSIICRIFRYINPSAELETAFAVKALYGRMRNWNRIIKIWQKKQTAGSGGRKRFCHGA